MGKLNIRAKDWEKNPALLRIMAMLEKAFNDVGEKIRKELRDAYRAHASESFLAFMNAIRSRTGPLKRDPRTYHEEYSNWHRYAELDLKKAPSDIRTFGIKTWEDYKSVAHLFKETYKYADKDADESYEHARDSFVYKNLDKISEVLGKRSDLKNGVIKFDWRAGYFKGNLQIYLQNAYFQGDVDIKYVIRTIPRVTPYFQYPLVFTDAEVNGKSYARPSEMELRNLLSGKTDEQHAAEREAQAVAEGWCPMSGKPAEGVKIRYGSTAYVKCPTCKSGVTVQHYKYRKHKTLQAEKVSAAKKLEDAGYCSMSKEQVPFPLIEKLIRSHIVWPGGVETKQYSYDLFDSMGKYRKLPCPSCGNNVVVSDYRDGLKPEEVKAFYQKHKIKK